MYSYFNHSLLSYKYACHSELFELSDNSSVSTTTTFSTVKVVTIVNAVSTISAALTIRAGTSCKMIQATHTSTGSAQLQELLDCY